MMVTHCKEIIGNCWVLRIFYIVHQIQLTELNVCVCVCVCVCVLGCKNKYKEKEGEEKEVSTELGGLLFCINLNYTCMQTIKK